MPFNKSSYITISTIIIVICIHKLEIVHGGPAIINIPYKQIPVISGRNIRHLPCISRRTGEEGVCMFAIDCLKANGSHLGTCIDRFYFGSCCKINENVLTHLHNNIIDTDNSITENDKIQSGTDTTKPFNTTSDFINKLKSTTNKPTTNLLIESKVEPNIADLDLNNSIAVADTTTESKITTAKVVTIRTTEVPFKLSTFQTVAEHTRRPTTQRTTTSQTQTTTKRTSTQYPNRSTIKFNDTITNKPQDVTKKPQRPTFKPILKPRPPYRPTFKPSTFSNTASTVTSTTKSTSLTQNPVTSTLKPIISTPKQATSSLKPVSSTQKLATSSTKPVSSTPKIASSSSKPVSFTPQPVSSTSKPITYTPKATISTPKPLRTNVTAIFSPVLTTIEASTTRRPIPPYKPPPKRTTTTRKPSTYPKVNITGVATRKPITTIPVTTTKVTSTTVAPPLVTTAAPQETTTQRKVVTSTAPLTTKLSSSTTKVTDAPSTTTMSDWNDTTMKDVGIVTWSYTESEVTKKPTTFNTQTDLQPEVTTDQPWSPITPPDDWILISSLLPSLESQTSTLLGVTSGTTESDTLDSTTTVTTLNLSSESAMTDVIRNDTTAVPFETTVLITDSTFKPELITETNMSQHEVVITTSPMVETTVKNTTQAQSSPIDLIGTQEGTAVSEVVTMPATTVEVSSSTTSTAAGTTSDNEDIKINNITQTTESAQSSPSVLTSIGPSSTPSYNTTTITSSTTSTAGTSSNADTVSTPGTLSTPSTASIPSVSSSIPSSSSLSSTSSVITTITTPAVSSTTTPASSGSTSSPISSSPSTMSSTISSSSSMSSLLSTIMSEASFNMSDYTQVCGRRLWPEARIVGGAKSGFGMWPWQISLRQWRTNTYLHKCGAALLSENWAITAAHCVENVQPSDLLVRLGEYDLANENEPYGFQERRIQVVASHNNFDPATFEYDLALLRFYEPVIFQPNIIPICVPDNDDNFVGQTAYVTGWGRLYDDGPLPSILQEVSVPVINNTLCEAMYRAAGFNEHIPNIFICAGQKKGGRDSCEGDSGGPMVIKRKDNRFVLGGIISWGIGCAEPNQPGVYTRISKFREWINQILQF